MINSPLAYQNRLRSCEYLRLLGAAHFALAHLEQVVDERALKDARTIGLAEEFQRYTPEDLAVTSTFLVARPA